MLIWQPVTAETWVLGDSESERALRQVAVLGPHLGEASPKYRVTGPGYDCPGDATLEDAMAVAERSLASSG